MPSLVSIASRWRHENDRVLREEEFATLALPFTGELDLAETFTCGQCFRWQRDGDAWSGVVDSRFVRARVDGAWLLLDGASDADAEFWRRYFAIDADYPALLERFAADPTLARCVAEAPGIRVLRQPFFETLVTFITSACNNIPRIAGIVERLADAFGDDLGGRRAFPDAARLASLPPEAFDCLRAGYRAPYIRDAARRAASGDPDEAVLRALPTDAARRLLMTVDGVGRKVADCVLLYALGRDEVCPVDVHMRRALSCLFPAGLPECCRGAEGIAQQFIFRYARAHRCELTEKVGSA